LFAADLRLLDEPAIHKRNLSWGCVMATTTDLAAGLAYDIEGSGTPVVFLHGLTFDRRTWRPIIDRLDGAVTSIAIDLPAHGDSGGEPAALERVAEQIHQLLETLGVERPVVVGHSMAAGIAGLYASAHPARGIVCVDQATEVLPFAQMLHQIAPMLCGPAFGQVWPDIENSLGLDRIPEPARTLVLDTHKVRQDVVLGYWTQVLTTEPAELQAWIDDMATEIQVPCLAVFGRRATDGERERLGRLPDAQIEEWPGDGHFVHLVDSRRFATRLETFVQHCDQAS
jgi:pimeloyl-ACP methyl ester carboxylesterase